MLAMDLQEVKVLVPASRVTEFYRWFADWSEGTAGESTTKEPVVDSPADQDEAAARFWNSLTRKERDILGTWVDAAPAHLSGQEIVDRLGLESPRVIPGALSWTGRKGEKVGFPVHWAFYTDAITGEAIYGLHDTEQFTAVQYAQILHQARQKVEGTGG